MLVVAPHLYFHVRVGHLCEHVIHVDIYHADVSIRVSIYVYVSMHICEDSVRCARLPFLLFFSSLQDLRPTAAVSIIETDMEVEFKPPEGSVVPPKADAAGGEGGGSGGNFPQQGAW